MLNTLEHWKIRNWRKEKIVAKNSFNSYHEPAQSTTMHNTMSVYDKYVKTFEKSNYKQKQNNWERTLDR